MFANTLAALIFLITTINGFKDRFANIPLRTREPLLYKTDYLSEKIHNNFGKIKEFFLSYDEKGKLTTVVYETDKIQFEDFEEWANHKIDKWYVLLKNTLFPSQVKYPVEHQTEKMIVSILNKTVELEEHSFKLPHGNKSIVYVKMNTESEKYKNFQSNTKPSVPSRTSMHHMNLVRNYIPSRNLRLNDGRVPKRTTRTDVRGKAHKYNPIYHDSHIVVDQYYQTAEPDLLSNYENNYIQYKVKENRFHRVSLENKTDRSKEILNNLLRQYNLIDRSVYDLVPDSNYSHRRYIAAYYPLAYYYNDSIVPHYRYITLKNESANSYFGLKYPHDKKPHPDLYPIHLVEKVTNFDGFINNTITSKALSKTLHYDKFRKSIEKMPSYVNKLENVNHKQNFNPGLNKFGEENIASKVPHRQQSNTISLLDTYFVETNTKINEINYSNISETDLKKMKAEMDPFKIIPKIITNTPSSSVKMPAEYEYVKKFSKFPYSQESRVRPAKSDLVKKIIEHAILNIPHKQMLNSVPIPANSTKGFSNIYDTYKAPIIHASRLKPLDTNFVQKFSKVYDIVKVPNIKLSRTVPEDPYFFRSVSKSYSLSKVPYIQTSQSMSSTTGFIKRFSKVYVISKDPRKAETTTKPKGKLVAKCFECASDLSDGSSSQDSCYDIIRKREVLTSDKRKYMKKCYRSEGVNTASRSYNTEYIGGCFTRFTDVGTFYTELGCRRNYTKLPPLRTGAELTWRYIKLEQTLSDIDNGCVQSPYASITPFAESLNLYARLHVCVCSGPYCNGGQKLSQSFVFVLFMNIFLL